MFFVSLRFKKNPWPPCVCYFFIIDTHAHVLKNCIGKDSYLAWSVYMTGKKEEIACLDDISTTRYIAFSKRFIGQAIYHLFHINRQVISHQKVQKPDIPFSPVTSASRYIAIHTNTPLIRVSTSCLSANQKVFCLCEDLTVILLL